VPLPKYAFQHKRYWLEAGTRAPGLEAGGHPLIDAVVPVAGEDEWVFTGRLSLRSQPWIAGHVVFGTVVLPSTTLLELLLAAGEHFGCDVVDDLTLEAPFLLSPDVGRDFQVTVEAPDDLGRRAYAIHSRAQGSD